MKCWQLGPIVGDAGNGAAEEDWLWHLNPGTAAIWRLFWEPRVLGGPPALEVLPFATWMVPGA